LGKYIFDYNFEEEIEIYTEDLESLGLFLEIQGFKVDLFALKLLLILLAVFSFVSLCEYAMSNENYLLNKLDT
jgi:hypothetical protein